MCPMPLDTTRALIFVGMMLFDNAMCAEEMPLRDARRAEDMVLLDDALRRTVGRAARIGTARRSLALFAAAK